ncbi:MAG TPA: secondary thiamine-phosphate synthase enzyme YjbQ [Actinomycetota bacterium]|nr:secondary thiamine-phosphate synthase enzyme YjbQ [Actinomycetota bacterium]
MNRTELTIETTGRRVVDITDEVSSFASSVADGILLVFVPHATAGLAVVETGAGSERDLEAAIDRLFPRDERYDHRHGSRGHGADHVIPAFVSPSLVLPLAGGSPVLGTWQRVVVVDPNRENNRRRVVLVSLEGSSA